MNYLAILLGLLLGLLPSFIEVYNKETKKITIMGYVVVCLAIVFVITSICNEKSDIQEKELFQAEVDSLKIVGIDCVFKIDSLKDLNYSIKDSLLSLKTQLIKKENLIYQTVTDHKRDSESYQLEIRKIESQKIELIEENNRTNIINDEPSITTLSMTIGNKDKKGEYPLKIVGKNFGRRAAKEFNTSIHYFISIQDKIRIDKLGKSYDAETFEIPGGTTFDINKNFPDISNLIRNEPVIIYTLLEYKYKDKLQKDTILGDEDIYVLEYKGNKYNVRKGLNGDFQKIKKYLKKNN